MAQLAALQMGLNYRLSSTPRECCGGTAGPGLRHKLQRYRSVWYQNPRPN